MKTIRTLAPANIALIKYMGKIDFDNNIAANPSLSMTLSELSTLAEFEISDSPSMGSKFKYIPEAPNKLPQSKFEFKVPSLSKQAIERIEAYMARARNEIEDIFKKHNIEMGSDKEVKLRTANTFPLEAGIASSSSSFAAVTSGVAAAFAKNLDSFKNLYKKDENLQKDLALISSRGSGSSARSFMGPFVKWDHESIDKIQSNLDNLVDLVCIVQVEAKKVKSSEAHKRVTSSPLWKHRVERVKNRLNELEAALKGGDIKNLALLSWTEAWEMHSLFYTCKEPFIYLNEKSMLLLSFLCERLKDDIPPIVTMDAGANVHVLTTKDYADTLSKKILDQFPDLSILQDEAGSGCKILD